MKVVFEEELLGSGRRNISSRDYDIFMFEMTLYVCYGDSHNIGIFVGGELWRSQLDHN